MGHFLKKSSKSSKKHDALLMHFHRVLMHFQKCIKSAPKVHHFFLMILMNFPEKNPIIGIAQGDKP
jgi:hypothetical protein